MATMLVSLNPLMCTALDPRLPGKRRAASADELLAWLCVEGSYATSAMAQRYRDALPVVSAVYLAPAAPRLLQKFVEPLKNALGDFCLGNYLGCIALSGMIGEMVATLLWDVDPPSDFPRDAKGKPISKRTFEEVPQKQKIDILLRLNRIDSDIEKAFVDLKDLRNRYLHNLSAGHDTLERDAREALDLAARLFTCLLRLSHPTPGAVAFRSKLMEYLSRQPG